jgi:ankyrin repeat protein
MLDININKLLFKFIKNHEHKKFIKLVLDNPDLDLNIRDNSNNYLIQYAVLYNNAEIVKLLLKRNTKIDVYDIDYRSILYIPIKYNYHELLKLILENEQESIGVTLVDYSDRQGMVALHHAINFANEKAIQIILKHYSDINQSDNEGNTFLHYAIKNKNIDIFKLILKHSPNINLQTKNGETPILLSCGYQQYDITKILYDMGANVNLQDHQEQITPIMYSIILNDSNLFNLLLPSSDLLIQDIDGNNSLHYSIAEDNTEIIDTIINTITDFNTSNLEGKIPLHLFLYKYRSNTHNVPINVNKFINKTNINLQDNKGVSCLYLLAKFNLWEFYKNTIQRQKMYAFQKNIKGHSIYGIVNDDKKDKFVDLLTESYLFQLRNKKRVWIDEIDELCSNKITYNEFVKVKDKYDIKMDYNELKKNKLDVCPIIIKNKIMALKRSYPRKKNYYCINFEDEKNVSFVTYTGDIIDIMFGIIHLKQKYKKIAVTTLSQSFHTNNDIQKYYKKNENRQTHTTEFTNIEIIWVNQNIFYPTILDESINKFKKSKKRFLIIPLGIELSIGSHANILIYDKKLNEIERFEPNGGSYPFTFNYNPQLLDQILIEKFVNIFEKVKYFKPVDFIPKIGFQYLESYSKKTHKIGDPGGFCGAWCAWYADIRLKYPDINRKKLILKSIRRVKEQGLKFKNLIRNFSKKITDLRDIYLNKVEIDINDWKNGSYKETQIEKLILNLQILIDDLQTE